MNPNCSKLFSFVCSHMVGDDCQTWKALVVLTDMYKSILHCGSKQPFFCTSGVNWDNSNPEPCCCYIILYCVTAIQSAYSLTSRRALQALCTWQWKHTPQGRVETRTFSVGGLHYSNTGVPYNVRPWPASVRWCVWLSTHFGTHTH